VQLILYEKADDIPNYKKKISSEHIGLVSINTSDENIAIKAELKENNVDFKPVNQVKDITVLKEDYEKLRLAYELSKVTLTNDLESHFERSLELIFEILPVDRGVILLLDQKTGMISPKHVKIRSDDIAIKEIALSSTILKRVYESRKCLVTSDIGNEKNNQQQAQDISQNIISTVICVPLIGHGVVGRDLTIDSWDYAYRFFKVSRYFFKKRFVCDYGYLQPISYCN
jgi:adenylate cyclase